MAIIPKPEFPNVPKLPGVPQLVRSPLAQATQLTIANFSLGQAALWKSVFSKTGWGVYRSIPTSSGSTPTPENTDLPEQQVIAKRLPVIEPDSFGEFSYRNEWSVSDFPVQEGQFASYNKVANPYEIMLRMYKGGSKEDRKQFLDSIDAISDTLELYDIVTPEKTYLSVNVIRYEVTRRGAGGAYFLSEVDLYFREIRQVTAVYSTTSVVTQNAQNFSAKPVNNVGTVFAQPMASTVTPEGLGL